MVTALVAVCFKVDGVIAGGDGLAPLRIQDLPTFLQDEQVPDQSMTYQLSDPLTSTIAISASKITSLFGGYTGKIEYRLNGDNIDQVLNDYKTIKLENEFLSRGFLIQLCYGDMKFNLKGPDGN